MNELAKQIALLNQNLAAQVPQETLSAFEKFITNLRTKGIEQSSIQVGDKFPSFSLSNPQGRIRISNEFLKNGKIIFAFYRDIWCPYCNPELKFLQKNLATITHKKATLVAISPQNTDNNMLMIEKHFLEFEVLTDSHNNLAKQLGISFHLQNFVLCHYNGLGINISSFNKC